MSTIGMLLPQKMQPDTVLPSKSGSGEGGLRQEAPIFRELLAGNQPFIKESEIESSIQQATSGKHGLTEHIPDHLLEMLIGSKEMEDLLENIDDDAITDEEIIQKVNELLDDLMKKASSTEESKPKYADVAPVFLYFQQSPDVMDKVAIQKQFADVFAKAETLLAKLESQPDVQKLAPQLLKLLEQWTSLESKLNSDQQPANLPTLKNGEGTKEQAIWKELVQAFQKRNQLVAKQQYNSNATVTGTDVSKWLQKALSMNNRLPVEHASGQSIGHSSMPMSRVEQYVIHVNQTQGSQTTSHQLVEQFQKVIRTSNFLTMNNGTSQLSIALRPENLGEMMVKLTQINGEMTVKIMVTSHATKEMLETNMHQLRNMFSPHQVVIERQDMNANQAQNFNDEQEKQLMDEHEQGHSGQSDQDNNDHPEEDFEAHFNEVLMNEKV